MKRRSRKNVAQVVTDRGSPLFDERHYEMTCAKKTAFTSEWQAKYDADRALEERGSKLSWYKCPYCGMWHLTSLSLPVK